MTIYTDNPTDPTDTDVRSDAQRYTDGQLERVRALDELLEMDADMLRAIVDVCNCAVSGDELDPDTEATPVDVSGDLLEMIGEYCNGDTDADDIVHTMMDDYVLEVKVTRILGDTDGSPWAVVLVVTLGGPHCEVHLDGSNDVRIVTHWGGDIEGRGWLRAGNFAGWWFDLVADMGGA